MCTNISCSLRGADELYDAMLSAAGDDPRFNVRASSAWARATSRRWRRSTASTSARWSPRTAARSSTTCSPGRPPLEAKQLRKRPKAEDHWKEARSERHAEILYKDLDEPGLNTLEVYEQRGGYEMLARRSKMEPQDVLEEMLASNVRGRGGAGFAMGKKMSFIPKGADGQVPRLQRGRVRARHLQGPRADAEEPASADRGDHHRRLRDRRQQVVHLHPRRVRPPGRHARRGAGRGARRRLHRRADPRLRPHARPRRPPRRRRLHLRRGDRAAGLAGGQARQPAPEAAVPRHPGPLPRADADQQRRDADERPGRARDGRRGVRRRSAPRTRPAPRSSPSRAASSGPGNYEIVLGTPSREIIFDLAGGPPEGRSDQGLVPRRLERPGAHGLRRGPRPRLRLRHAGQGRLDARLGRDHRRRRLDLDRRRGAQDGEVLPPRVLRQVHPVPRGHQLDREDARARQVGRGDPDGPRHHGLGLRADHRQLPVRARRRDGDADRLDGQAVPRASSRSTSRRRASATASAPAIPQVNRGRQRRPGPMREPTGIDPTAAVA